MDIDIKEKIDDYLDESKRLKKVSSIMKKIYKEHDKIDDGWKSFVEECIIASDDFGFPKHEKKRIVSDLDKIEKKIIQKLMFEIRKVQESIYSNGLATTINSTNS